MALKFTKQLRGSGARVRPGVRLYLDGEDKLVEAGDPNARSLYCSQFAEVPRAEFEALVEKSGLSIEPEKPKSKPARENKEEKPAENKDDAPPSGLDSMNVAQLDALIDAKGLEVDKKLKKAEKIAAITAALKGA